MPTDVVLRQMVLLHRAAEALQVETDVSQTPIEFMQAFADRLHMLMQHPWLEQRPALQARIAKASDSMSELVTIFIRRQYAPTSAKPTAAESEGERQRWRQMQRLFFWLRWLPQAKTVDEAL
jgi:hypothetical protein